MNIKIMRSVSTLGPQVTASNAKHRVLHKNVVRLIYFAYSNEKYSCVSVKGTIFFFSFQPKFNFLGRF